MEYQKPHSTNPNVPPNKDGEERFVSFYSLWLIADKGDSISRKSQRDEGEPKSGSFWRAPVAKTCGGGGEIAPHAL